jgi:DNA-binding SARP family transcriptional activator
LLGPLLGPLAADATKGSLQPDCGPRLQAGCNVGAASSLGHLGVRGGHAQQLVVAELAHQVGMRLGDVGPGVAQEFGVGTSSDHEAVLAVDDLAHGVCLLWKSRRGECAHPPSDERLRHRYRGGVLAIRVLGRLTVELDGTTLPVERGRRVPSVTGWLALRPGLQPRARLAAVFWPDVSDATARNNLRQVVWDLRRLLGPGAVHLGGDRDHIGLLDGPNLWVDVRAFDALVAEHRLAEAAALVRGDLLEGLEDSWIDEERAHRRRQLGEVLARLGDELEAAGDVDGSLAVTRRLAGLDPYDEVAQRQLLRRLSAAGRRTEALGAYDRFVALLRDDLGVEPAVATVKLVDQIRHSPAMVTPASVSPPAALDLLSGTGRPFVGRRAELDRLAELWGRVSAGGQHIVGIEGEAGIGKTRLAAELAARLASAGAVVIVGRSTEDQLIPYQSWVEALRNHARGRVPDALRTELPAGAEAMLPLVPELATLVAGPANAPAGASSDRFRMFQAVVDWLHAIAAGRPTLLVLDDLHFADPASLELLRHLARNPAPVPLLVLLTCRTRSGELGEQHAATMAECSRHGLTWVQLGGLDEDDLAALVAQSTDAPPSPDFARVLHHRTGGNPFFVTEIVRNLTDSGALVIREGAWVWDLSRGDVMLPEGVRQVLERRLARLGPVLRRALEAGAVAGHEFPDSLVSAVTAVPPDTLLDVLDAAVGSGLVVEHAEPGMYAFAHPLVRDVVYSSLTLNRRASLHERVGDALAALDGPAMAVAHHLLEAGTDEARRRALPFVFDAATAVLRQGAYEDLVTLLDRVLALDEAVLGPDRRRILSLRGLAFSALGSLTLEGRPARATLGQPGAEKNSGASSPSGGMSTGATSPASS